MSKINDRKDSIDEAFGESENDKDSKLQTITANTYRLQDDYEDEQVNDLTKDQTIENMKLNQDHDLRQSSLQPVQIYNIQDHRQMSKDSIQIVTQVKTIDKHGKPGKSQLQNGLKSNLTSTHEKSLNTMPQIQGPLKNDAIKFQGYHNMKRNSNYSQSSFLVSEQSYANLPDVLGEARQTLIQSIYDNHQIIKNSKVDHQQYASNFDSFKETNNQIVRNGFNGTNSSKEFKKYPELDQKRDSIYSGANHKKSLMIDANTDNTQSFYGEEQNTRNLRQNQTNDGFDMRASGIHGMPPISHLNPKRKNLFTNSTGSLHHNQSTKTNMFSMVPTSQMTQNDIVHSQEKKTIYGISIDQSNQLKEQASLVNQMVNTFNIQSTNKQKKNTLLLHNQKEEMVRNLKKKQNKYQIDKTSNGRYNTNVSVGAALGHHNRASSQQDFNQDFKLKLLTADQKKLNNYDSHSRINNMNRSVMQNLNTIKIDEIDFESQDDNNISQIVVVEAPQSSIMSSQKPENHPLFTHTSGKFQTIEQNQRKSNHGHWSRQKNEMLKTFHRINSQSVSLTGDQLAGFTSQFEELSKINEDNSIQHDLMNSYQNDLANQSSQIQCSQIQKTRAEKQQIRINEAERKRIEAVRKDIDIIELKVKDKMSENVSEKLGENFEFNVSLNYFKQIKESLRSVFLTQAPAGKKVYQFYSKQLQDFIEFIVKSMDEQLKHSEKYINQGINNKDLRIQDMSKIISDLQNKITNLKAQLLSEDQILSNDRIDKVRKEIDEFLKNKIIQEARIDGDFDVENQEKDENLMQIKKMIDKNGDSLQLIGAAQKFYDIKGLLQLSKYSGAQESMNEILKNNEFIRRLEQDRIRGQATLTERPSMIDKELLDDQRHQHIGQLMENFVQDKTKSVQLATSKNVIKQFLKKIASNDVQTQTKNKDEEYLIQLKQKIKDLQVELNDVRADLYNANATNDKLSGKLVTEQIKASTQAKLTDNFKIQIKESQKFILEAEEETSNVKQQLKEEQKMRKKDIDKLNVQQVKSKDRATELLTQIGLLNGIQKQMSEQITELTESLEQTTTDKRRAQRELDKTTTEAKAVKMDQIQKIMDLEEEIEKLKRKMSKLKSKQNNNQGEEENSVEPKTEQEESQAMNEGDGHESQERDKISRNRKLSISYGSQSKRSKQYTISVKDSDGQSVRTEEGGIISERTHQRQNSTGHGSMKDGNNSTKVQKNKEVKDVQNEQNGQKERSNSINSKKKKPIVKQGSKLKVAKGNRNNKGTGIASVENAKQATTESDSTISKSQYTYDKGTTVTTKKRKTSQKVVQDDFNINKLEKIDETGREIQILGDNQDNEGRESQISQNEMVQDPKYEKITSPERYQYYLEKPKENLDKSQAMLDRIIDNKVGKHLLMQNEEQLSVWYSVNHHSANIRQITPNVAKIHVQCQTEIDTNTFKLILDSYKTNKILIKQSLKNADLLEKANSIIRKEFKNDFGQQVEPMYIKYEMDLMSLQLKNQRMLYHGNVPEPQIMLNTPLNENLLQYSEQIQMENIYAEVSQGDSMIDNPDQSERRQPVNSNAHDEQNVNEDIELELKAFRLPTDQGKRFQHDYKALIEEIGDQGARTEEGTTDGEGESKLIKSNQLDQGEHTIESMNQNNLDIPDEVLQVMVNNQIMVNQLKQNKSGSLTSVQSTKISSRADCRPIKLLKDRNSQIKKPQALYLRNKQQSMNITEKRSSLQLVPEAKYILENEDAQNNHETVQIAMQKVQGIEKVNVKTIKKRDYANSLSPVRLANNPGGTTNQIERLVQNKKVYNDKAQIDPGYNDNKQLTQSIHQKYSAKDMKLKVFNEAKEFKEYIEGTNKAKLDQK